MNHYEWNPFLNACSISYTFINFLYSDLSESDSESISSSKDYNSILLDFNY
jgi:hypothetical protein